MKEGKGRREEERKRGRKGGREGEGDERRREEEMDICVLGVTSPGIKCQNYLSPCCRS